MIVYEISSKLFNPLLLGELCGSNPSQTAVGPDFVVILRHSALFKPENSANVRIEIQIVCVIETRIVLACMPNNRKQTK